MSSINFAGTLYYAAFKYLNYIYEKNDSEVT